MPSCPRRIFGARSAPTQRHLVNGGQELALLTAGEITLRSPGGEEVYAVGHSWPTHIPGPSGLVHAAGDNGAEFAQAVATFLLPADRPLTSVV